MQMCLKTLAHLFREVENFTMTENKLTSIIGVIRTTLEDTENPNVVFSILKVRTLLPSHLPSLHAPITVLEMHSRSNKAKLRNGLC